MEEGLVLTAIAAAAVPLILALFVADLIGALFGLGWRHFSKKFWTAARARKAKK